MGLLVAAWLGTMGTSMLLVERYKATPGAAATAPDTWPSASHIERAPDRATLVMLVHPRCPCSRASVSELAELMERAGDRLKARVLFLHPAGTAQDWEKTDLWRSAAAIPGVTPVADDDGAEAERFGAKTSGQTLVYDAAGRLVFRGGLTPARGHAGNSVGRDRIARIVLGETRLDAPVFGCDLHDPEGEE